MNVTTILLWAVIMTGIIAFAMGGKMAYDKIKERKKKKEDIIQQNFNENPFQQQQFNQPSSQNPYFNRFQQNQFLQHPFQQPQFQQPQFQQQQFQNPTISSISNAPDVIYKIEVAVKMPEFPISNEESITINSRIVKLVDDGIEHLKKSFKKSKLDCNINIR